MSTLRGKKQTPEHVEKRRQATLRHFANHPRKLLDNKKKIQNKILVDKNGCWVWQGAVFKKKWGNYGQIRIGRLKYSKVKRAHRVSYEEYVGPIPNGLELDHLCRNTLCVNPRHLEPVTHAENMRRKIKCCQ